MEHLSRIEFKNFQSLENTALELAPGFNVIVGPSNLGKSAALRGIRALIRNAPAPGLVREGCKEFELTASFTSGDKVSLVKGKNKSVFTVNGAEFAKAGVKAPDEVGAVWAMANVDGRELSYATQHEPPFLLAEPASAVAKVLGELTNANALMEAVQRANKLRTEALNDAKARHREAEEARDEILTHAGLSTKLKVVAEARELLSAAEEVTQKRDALAGLFAQREAVENALSVLPQGTLDVDELIEQVDSTAQVVVELSQMLAEYEQLATELTRTDHDISEHDQSLYSTEQEIHQTLDDAGVCPLCERKL